MNRESPFCINQRMLMIRSRITSYNVCYTKLLRLIDGNDWNASSILRSKIIVPVISVTIPGDKEKIKIYGFGEVKLSDKEIAAVLQHRYGDGLVYLPRITSYNVCYTKLLRYKNLFTWPG